MDFDFDKALDDFSVVISDFESSGFTRNDIVLPKTQYVLVSAF